MSGEQPHDPDEHRIGERADLLPEEERAGSDDPLAQAAEILRESDERTSSEPVEEE